MPRQIFNPLLTKAPRLMRTLEEILDDHRQSCVRTDAWSGDYGGEARTAYRPLLSRWIVRIYAGAGGMPPYCEPGRANQAVIAQITGIKELADPAATALQVSQAIESANATDQALGEPEPTNPLVLPCHMLTNIDWLSSSAGLTRAERAIFEFAVALRAFPPLQSAVATWGSLSFGELIHALSTVLRIPNAAVALACQPQSTLLIGGLLRINEHEGPMGELLRAPRHIAQRLPFHQGDPSLILAHLVLPMVAPALQLADFNHMAQDTQLAQCWLAGALACAARGEHSGHLLVSGPPGLGKTEWVRALLTQAKAQAMELAVLLANGAPLSGQDRLSHLRLAMRLLRSTPRGVIVFDEADDVFSNEHELGEGDKEAVTMVNHRASLNRLIEESQVPVIWIMNRPEVLDAAVLRRFDTVIAFDNVPRSVRLSLLAEHGQWDNCDIHRWADIPTLTPALIDRLATVQSRAAQASQVMDAELCSHWLRRRLPGKATRHLGPAAAKAQSVPWDAQLVNASEDLLALAEGIKRCGRARILLHGPAGTGKTAFAHALALMLDRPLMEQRASDLLSPYVGETEQRISRAFDAALIDGALLFLDEADSLLASRAHAVRNWEVSQVNELLEHLGEFEGVVVLATNRLDALDAAALRRLDAKIEFEALSPAQARGSFARLCQQLGLPCAEAVLLAVANLHPLTPGDFACVLRRLAFAPLAPEGDHALALLALLTREVRLKTQGRQTMGFRS